MRSYMVSSVIGLVMGFGAIAMVVIAVSIGIMFRHSIQEKSDVTYSDAKLNNQITTKEINNRVTVYTTCYNGISYTVSHKRELISPVINRNTMMPQVCASE